MVRPDKSFWSGKRVFVTGHTGFKGSWLCEFLLSMGALLCGYSLAPGSNPNHYDLLDLSKRVTKSVIGDIRDAKRLEEAIISFNPEIVLHLAAQPLVSRSYKEPIETLSVNIMGTAILLNACLVLKQLRSVVVVTSDKCYENPQSTKPLNEEDALGGHDPYSASKACAELVTSSWRDSFFADQPHVGIASARAGNIIGGGDWSEDRLIPDIIRARKNNQPVRIRNANAVRPWQYVLDPLTGYLLLAQRLYEQPEQFAGAWNFGPPPDQTHTVGEILDLARKTAGFEFDASYEKEAAFHEGAYLRLDSQKAVRRLGWEPRLNIEEAVAETASWYQAFETNNQTARVLTDNQIRKYMA